MRVKWKIIGQLGVPLGHSPTRPQTWRGGGLEQLPAKPRVPLQPVVLGDPPGDLPGPAQVIRWHRQLLDGGVEGEIPGMVGRATVQPVTWQTAGSLTESAQTGGLQGTLPSVLGV